MTCSTMEVDKMTPPLVASRRNSSSRAGSGVLGHPTLSGRRTVHLGSLVFDHFVCSTSASGVPSPVFNKRLSTMWLPATRGGRVAWWRDVMRGFGSSPLLVRHAGLSGAYSPPAALLRQPPAWQ